MCEKMALEVQRHLLAKRKKSRLTYDNLNKLFSSYGTNLDGVLNKVYNLEEMEERLRGELYESEVNYLHRFE